jgi:hypothetical protein
MISAVEDTWATKVDVESLMGLLGNKSFLAGPNPTFIDFCVFESLLKFEGKLPDVVSKYRDRVQSLGEPVIKPSVGNSKML